MKSLYTLLALVIALPAFASTTTTLAPDAPFRCYNSGICLNPPTDGAATVNYINLSCGAGCVSVSVNEVLYSSGLNAVDKTPVNGVIALTGVPLYAADGSQIVFTAQFSYRTFQLNSGRAHYWVHEYILLSGQVVLP